jgi:hypothetical protein
MLFCITANYTPKAMQAMAKKPNTNRSEAFEKLVKARGRQVGCHVRHHDRRPWCAGDL